MLFQYLHPYGPLSGNDQGVIEGRDEHHASLFLEHVHVGLGFIIIVTVQNNLRPQTFDRIDLDLGRGLGHDNDGLDPQFLGGQRDSLGMVPGGSRDHAGPFFLIGQRRNPVIRPPQLVGKNRLLILPF